MNGRPPVVCPDVGRGGCRRVAWGRAGGDEEGTPVDGAGPGGGGWVTGDGGRGPGTTGPGTEGGVASPVLHSLPTPTENDQSAALRKQSTDGVSTQTRVDVYSGRTTVTCPFFTSEVLYPLSVSPMYCLLSTTFMYDTSHPRSVSAHGKCVSGGPLYPS